MIIAVVNHKGGVAKTATVSALGYLLSSSGAKTLMLDLDTQANLTYSVLDMEANTPNRFIFDSIQERKNLPQVAVSENLYLSPSGLEMTLIESQMQSYRRREYVLKDLLADVRRRYDFIVLDCPPSLNLLTTNALAACDRVLVPMQVDQLSYYGLKMLKAYIESINDINRGLQIDDILFTFYDKRERLTRQCEAQIREEFGDKVLKSTIRRAVKVKESIANHCSVVKYDAASPVSQDYLNFANELMERLTNTFDKDDLNKVETF